MALIPLTKGYRAIVDDEDYDACMMLGDWRALVQPRTTYAYLNTLSPNRTLIYLHRFLLGADEGVDVDHRDGNGLHNEKDNLREATRSQNIANSVKTWSSCGLRGVHGLARGRFQAAIKFNQKKIYLGTFDNAIEAAAMYESKRRELFGKFAPTQRG